jgi:hypothetical protein
MRVGRAYLGRLDAKDGYDYDCLSTSACPVCRDRRWHIAAIVFGRDQRGWTRMIIVDIRR